MKYAEISERISIVAGLIVAIIALFYVERKYPDLTVLSVNLGPFMGKTLQTMVAFTVIYTFFKIIMERAILRGVKDYKAK
ncbi:MAG: hypothetical protein V1934_03950, partial [Methanobacteriota archaeon]